VVENNEVTEFDDAEPTIQNLEQRIDELEFEVERLKEEAKESRAATASIGYAMGMALAMILSWSKNASILWCMLHGLLSWIYVIYFAVKR